MVRVDLAKAPVSYRRRSPEMVVLVNWRRRARMSGRNQYQRRDDGDETRACRSPAIGVYQAISTARKTNTAQNRAHHDKFRGGPDREDQLTVLSSRK